MISHLHAHGNADDPEVRREFAEITEVIEKERQIEKPWKNLIEPRTSRPSVLVVCASNGRKGSYEVCLSKLTLCRLQSQEILLLCVDHDLLPNHRIKHSHVSGRSAATPSSRLTRDSFFFPLILANAGINSVKTILIVIACLTGCIFFCVITGGWLSDRFGRKKILGKRRRIRNDV